MRSLSNPTTDYILQYFAKNSFIFFKAPYSLEVKEDTPVGTTIFSDVKLRDADSVGETLEVTCVEVLDFPNACQTFRIEPIDAEQDKYNGAIVLQSHLNYSLQESFLFMLNATVRALLISYFLIEDSPYSFLGWNAA